MNNWTASLPLPTLDRFIRVFLFPLSVLFSVGALVLSITTFSDLQETSISSAFSTVQSVEEAYRLETVYPSSVVLSNENRHLVQFWVASVDGMVLASSDTSSIGAPLDAAIWGAREHSVNGEMLEDYSLSGSSYVIAGAMDPAGEFWTFVQLSPDDALSSIIWLILAILALSLISVSGLIAVSYMDSRGERAAEHPGMRGPDKKRFPTLSVDLSGWQVGGDGSPHLVNPSVQSKPTSLHEAVLRALDDFVLVLDQDGRLVYSNPIMHLSEIEQMVELDGISAFSDRFLDDKARARFEHWLRLESDSKNLIVDVQDTQGERHQTRWAAHSLEMSPGVTYDVLVGQRTLIEQFPLASL